MTAVDVMMVVAASCRQGKPGEHFGLQLRIATVDRSLILERHGHDVKGRGIGADGREFVLRTEDQVAK